MEYRRLGASGLKVSALSYGSWVSFSLQLGRRLTPPSTSQITSGGAPSGATFHSLESQTNPSFVPSGDQKGEWACSTAKIARGASRANART